VIPRLPRVGEEHEAGADAVHAVEPVGGAPEFDAGGRIVAPKMRGNSRECAENGAN